ncbi:MAG: glutamine--fructose-6-phosphate transaminase (isomerizing) [Candidatus Omnitrophica bacterium]|nr:glutamine--fructose-6-phosphate transaminase (isomerizing) [Candidatus Omnitrophota bacterium]
MCGIVGYIGRREVLPVLVRGLEGLEYRGYDSSGLACFDPEHSRIVAVKEKGKLDQLKARLEGFHHNGCIGIGHTRWATHGAPTRDNAHPHLDASEQFAIVHNGIIENYERLKTDLLRAGTHFKSETDTEVFVHTWGRLARKIRDVREAFRQTVLKCHGRFAFVGMSLKTPDRIFVFRRSNPIVIGAGSGEYFVASDVTALLPYTREVIYLEDDEMAEVLRSEVKFYNVKTGKRMQKKSIRIDWSSEQAQKGGWPHFMIKEIHEQPDVLETALAKRIQKGRIVWDTLSKKAEARLKKIRKIFAVSCGTAFHAGLAGKYMLEEYAKIPVETSVSSEFRYSDPILEKEDMVLLVSQSGETADTLAALHEAKERGAFSLALVNVVGSTLAREADAVIYTHAGPEIGVASTKAYTAQLIHLALFSIYLGKLRGKISNQNLKTLLGHAKKLPAHIRQFLVKGKAKVEECADALSDKPNLIYLGRGYNYPTALEGALKFKEITYKHAHGYAAGEMKHGPIALVDKNLPVVSIAPASKTYEKMMSNIEEVKARDGIIVSIGTRGDEKLRLKSKYFLEIPSVPEIFSCILTVIPLQLLAYQAAVLNGREVDQPRNLAKSVTVE